MIGVKTMFIRFGGCDYRCQKCDSMHAVHPQAVKQNAQWLEPRAIIDGIQAEAKGTLPEWITISGGNPAIWDMSELVGLLHSQGYKIAVETQGSVWRDWLADVDQLTVCPKGPGMGERFNPEVFIRFLSMIEDNYNRMASRLAVAIKCVIFDQRDFEFALGLDEILDQRNLELKGNWWPKTDRYMSLGNPYPPKLMDNMKLDESDDEEVIVMFENLPRALLSHYQVLLEDFLGDNRLSHWIFLPQLHVLIWSNKGAV